MHVGELATPCLVVDRDSFGHNLGTMSAALPGSRLRPHVKAHKCTELARRQAEAGHLAFTCATIREAEGMAAAGLGADLLLANEVLDARRLGDLVSAGHRVTAAVDSVETIEAAARGAVSEVVIDVNVGQWRCGCAPAKAGPLAEMARDRGLVVRGVMGYEGHVVGLAGGDEREQGCRTSMERLVAAHADVGGELITGGGTGTYAINTWVNEVQAGTYILMDTAYQKLGLPFRQAVFVLATVVSSSPRHSVADCGLKALGMDHGDPYIEGAEIWSCSDEHVSFAPAVPVGSRILVAPAHLDPTLAYHSRMFIVEDLLRARDDAEVSEFWEIDLRGW